MFAKAAPRRETHHQTQERRAATMWAGGWSLPQTWRWSKTSSCGTESLGSEVKGVDLYLAIGSLSEWPWPSQHLTSLNPGFFTYKMGIITFIFYLTGTVRNKVGWGYDNTVQTGTGSTDVWDCGSAWSAGISKFWLVSRSSEEASEPPCLLWAQQVIK